MAFFHVECQFYRNLAHFLNRNGRRKKQTEHSTPHSSCQTRVSAKRDKKLDKKNPFYHLPIMEGWKIKKKTSLSSTA